jgi:DNA-binding transcriptional ArsR family regulator
VASSDAVDASALKALGHPLRMQMLTLIAERGEASPVEMSRVLGRSLATVSHHARVLRDSGYIELSRTQPRRGALEHFYRATSAPFLDDEHWQLLPAPARRRVSAALFRQVFKDAAAAGQRGGFDAAGAHIARLPLDLDVRGWDELSRAVHDLLKRAEAIQARSDKRRNGSRSDAAEPGPSELAILHFGTAIPEGSSARLPRLP